MIFAHPMSVGHEEFTAPANEHLALSVSLCDGVDLVQSYLFRVYSDVRRPHELLLQLTMTQFTWLDRLHSDILL
jgi:hypothetical protein